VRVQKLTFSAKQPARNAKFDDNHPLDHFGCWRHLPPATPRRTSVNLVDGRDFDAVVFATGIEDFKRLCSKDLGRQNERWKRMFESTETVATQAAQVWMTKDLTDLGWRRGSALVSALEGPFETWADMTHTFPAERAWRAHPGAPATAKNYGADVKSIAYFCGLLPQRDVSHHRSTPSDYEKTKQRLEALVQRNLGDLLAERTEVFWPEVRSRADRRQRGALRFLASERGGTGGELREQHVQASFEGSDRYTLAVPGSLEHRISPLARLVLNMTIAGDWTECGFNEGCIEAAVMSGMLAANAISGLPELDAITGYHHP
jgi:hypothetical protein